MYRSCNLEDFSYSLNQSHFAQIQSAIHKRPIALLSNPGNLKVSKDPVGKKGITGSPDLSMGSTRRPDVSKKPGNFDTSLRLGKQVQECRVEDYLLAPGRCHFFPVFLINLAGRGRSSCVPWSTLRSCPFGRVWGWCRGGSAGLFRGWCSGRGYGWPSGWCRSSSSWRSLSGLVADSGRDTGWSGWRSGRRLDVIITTSASFQYSSSPGCPPGWTRSFYPAGGAERSPAPRSGWRSCGWGNMAWCPSRIGISPLRSQKFGKRGPGSFPAG